MAGLTYATYQTQLAQLAVVDPLDSNFQTILPEVIEYAEFETTVIKVWYAGDAKNPTYCERYVVTEDHMKNQDQVVLQSYQRHV